jgi:hypothetical protein
LKPVSQTSPSWMTVRRKSRQIVGTRTRPPPVGLLG